MEPVSSFIYNELNPAKKDYKWANQCIQIMRRDWRPMKNVVTGMHNRSILYSMQDMSKIKASFKDKKFLEATNMVPLPIWEALINTLVEEVTKDPPKMEVKAVDPMAKNLKKKDLEILRARRLHEQNMSAPQQGVGMPPYVMNYDMFRGNIDEFDRMGLNPDDIDDVNFYIDQYQRLDVEISLQSIINNVVKANKYDQETLRRMMKDAAAFKVVSVQVYVDQVTGEIKCMYIDPQCLKGIWGKSNSGKGDICKGWEDSKTVMEFMGMVGDAFDFNRDWRYLLWAVNYYSPEKFTGFIRNGIEYNVGNDIEWCARMGIEDPTTAVMLDWTMAYKYRVYVGYIEWESDEATASYLRKKTDPNFSEIINYDYELSKKQIQEEYCKEDYFQKQWYRSYFLQTSSVTQWLYGFQKVYYQHLEGVNDEYSNGTISYYQEEGLSAAEISKPYIELAHFAYYRMLWIIYKAKPEIEEYQYEELLQLSKNFKRDFGQMADNKGTNIVESVLNQILDYQHTNHIRLRAFPRADGKIIPHNNTIDRKETGGLDPTAIAMQSICAWAEQQIAAKIGMNPIRLGANPQSRSSFDSQQEVKSSSENTTSYMYRMIQYVKQNNAITVFNYALDILNYPDSIAYKWLHQMSGDKTMIGLKKMENISAHRWGIFVNDYNAGIDKQLVMQQANIALTNKEISLYDWIALIGVEDQKAQARELALKKMRAEKKLREQQIQDFQMQQQAAQKQFEMQMALQNNQGQIDQNNAMIPAQATVQAAQIDAQNKLDVKRMQVDSDIPKQMAKAQGQKEVDANKQNLENQDPYIVQQQAQ